MQDIVPSTKHRLQTTCDRRAVATAAVKVSTAVTVALVSFSEIPKLAAGAANSSSKSNSIELFDGRAAEPKWDMRNKKPVLAPAEKKILQTQVLPRAKKKWLEIESPSYKPLMVIEGSFTTKGSKQRLVYYQYADLDSFGIYGIAVLQNGNLVASYGYKGKVVGNILTLPDINKDGRNEILLEDWSVHQGFRYGRASIIELDGKDVKNFGFFDIAKDDLNKNILEKFVLEAKPGSSPVFLTTKYLKAQDKLTRLNNPMTATPRPDTTEYYRLGAD